jgi:N,N-dimethylformamidase
VDRAMITGYCDRLSVQPGDTLRFMVSAEGVEEAEVGIVRLIHGDEHPAGPGFLEREVAAPLPGPIKVMRQYSQLGSFVEVPDPDGRCLPDGSFTVHAFIWPTTPGKGRQGILTQWSAAEQRGFALGIDDGGHLACWIGDGRTVAEVAADRALIAQDWYFVAASYDAASRRVTLYQEPVLNAWNSRLSPIVPRDDSCHLDADVGIAPARLARPALFAGYHARESPRGDYVAGVFNGKIDRAGIQSRVLTRRELDELRRGGEPPADGLVARWDTSAGYTDRGIGDRVVDTGPHGLHGIGRNRPVRAMTGYNWRGRDDCFRLAPDQYGGIYFHDDAIIDSGWCPSFEWRVPDGLASGVYAARLRGGGAEDHITFFVRSRSPQAKIAMLMPTASYLAYANERFVIETPAVELITGHPLVLYDWDYALAAHPEWGKSSYDHHGDGAGVCYTSYLRPIMGLRPRHRMASTNIPWQFPADMSIVYWLEKKGYAYDVITDEDLHRDGVACLKPYNVVLTGTHSEYYSERMLDATEQYLAAGGRMMYLGANGFYWNVAFRDEEPWCMEIRKLDAGSRAWQAAPGEYYMATTGEKGGIWRIRGRAPQKLTGVGFTSEGMDESMPYHRLPDSHDPAVSWVFDGVTAETFGDFGLAGNGAAGIELDRYDLSLGTPPGTWLLACSIGFSDAYPHVVEEVMFNYPGLGGTQDFQVRADMTLAATTNGGAVFSTGSIAWGQALPCFETDNDVARITANVLDRFMQDGPLAL